MEKKRIEEIDIVKALAIICMVVGHSGAPFTDFVYLFHMAVFFIASGFFYKNSSSDSLQGMIELIIRKMKQLWIPYFVWNMIFTILNNLFITINIYTSNQEVMNYVSGKYVETHGIMGLADMVKNIVAGAVFSGGTEIGGAFWFLKILFMVSVSYCIVDFFIKKIIKKYILVVQLFVSLVLLIFGYWCYGNGINTFGVPQMASCYCLYYMGYLLGIVKDKYCNWNWKQHLPTIFISFLTLLFLENVGKISLGSNSYVNPAFLMLASLAGWCLLYGIAYFINLLKVKKIFLEIGKRTLSIVIFHFLAFKIVASVIVLVYELPSFCIAAFPNLYGDKGMWWLLYSIVGVTVPILLNVMYGNVRRLIIKGKSS